MARRLGLRTLGVALVGFTLSVGACTKPLPEAAQEHLRRGDAALAEGRYAEALAAYAHARELAPAEPLVQRGMMRARAHLITESGASVSPDAIEDARYELSVLLETDVARAPVYLTALANLFVRQGNTKQAKAKLAEALQRDPSSPVAHRALGLLLMTSKESAAMAKAEFELVLKVKPEDGRALLALGELALASGDIASASAHLEAALGSADGFDLRMALGRTRAAQANAREAAEHFSRASQLDPTSPEALAAWGEALLNSERPAEAERALRAAIHLRPDVTSRAALGYALLRQGQPGSALDLFREVLAQAPRAAPAIYGAGKASEELGHDEEATEYYRRLTALSVEELQRQQADSLQQDAQRRLAKLAKPAEPRASAGRGPR